MREKLKNQCQGCTSGWEVKEVPSMFDNGVTNMYHVVEGGYEYDIVVYIKHLGEEK